MADEILTTVKEQLGVQADDNSFDSELLIHINSVFMILTQLGVGAESGVEVEATTKWSDVIEAGSNLGGVKAYVFIKVKLIFDTPSSSFVVAELKENAKEYEWRIINQAEEGGEDE